MKIDKYLHLYLGCNTNLGQLTGVNKNSYSIRMKNGEIIERAFIDETLVKLFLRKISDLNIEESAELNRLGLNIGRPKGYSFTPEAMWYLLSLRIDLFNLIAEGLAIEIHQ